jgi:3-hydroxyisobutyrate dehydrogenase
VFDAVGARTVWLGEAGSAQRLKLVLNTWLLGLTEALAESIALAEALGIDPRTFLETIDGAPVGAPYAQLKGPMMIDGEFPPAFPLALAAKDAGLALEAAEAAGLRLGALAAVREQMLRAADAGHGDEDMAATIHASRPD